MEIQNRKLRLAQGSLIQLASGSADGKQGQRQFTMLAYSGAKVMKYGADVVFNISGMDVAGGGQVCPILKNHDENQIVGQSFAIQKTESNLTIQGRLSSTTNAAKEVIALADEGFQWQASTGLQLNDVTFIPEGTNVRVNGREFQGPIYVVNKSELYECSFVPAGADPNTAGVVLSFAELAKHSPACSGSGTAALGVTKEVVMVKENEVPAPAPVNVEKITAEARENAAKLERERFAALSAKFPNHAKFVSEQFGKGATVEQAEVSFKDVLLAEKDEEISKLKAGTQNAVPKPSGVPPVHFGAGQSVSNDAGKDFMVLARERATEKKCGMTQAMSEVAKEQPETHEAWVKAQHGKLSPDRINRK